MDRDKKNQQTQRKIIDSALLEFSEKSYGEASLNAICVAGNISKGIIYHYFKDKDELYLYCVKECYDTLTEYLNSVGITNDLPIEGALENYFDARIKFFGKNPLYLGVFCSAIMNPPLHLTKELSEITKSLEAQAVSILTSLLETVKLRLDVTVQDVVEVFCEYQDFVNARFQMKRVGNGTLKEHEERCSRSLKILLYGVIERER